MVQLRTMGAHEEQGVMREHLLGPGAAPLSLPQYMPSVAATHYLGTPVQVNGPDQWPREALIPGARPGTALLGWVLQPGTSPGTCAAPGARPGNTAPTLGDMPGATPGTPPIIERYVLDPENTGPPRRQLVLDC